MSEEKLEKLREVLRNIDRYRPEVEERFKQAGTEVEPVLITAMAKYWPALKKLAAE